MKTLKDLKEAALKNIEDDRKKATEIINAISLEIVANKGTYSFHAQSFAKLIETMQRSNEQLVKLVSLEKEKEEKSSDAIDKSEFDEIYEELASKNSSSSKTKKT